MEKTKGCGNESCEAHKNKLIYKETEAFCSKCGRPLVYVCKDCFTQLPADTDIYCVRCLAKQQDKKNKLKKVALKFGSGALFAGGVIYKYGKKALDVLKMIKG